MIPEMRSASEALELASRECRRLIGIDMEHRLPIQVSYLMTEGFRRAFAKRRLFRTVAAFQPGR